MEIWLPGTELAQVDSFAEGDEKFREISAFGKWDIALPYLGRIITMPLNVDISNLNVGHFGNGIMGAIVKRGRVVSFGGIVGGSLGVFYR